METQIKGRLAMFIMGLLLFIFSFFFFGLAMIVAYFMIELSEKYSKK
jgi:hypothetical protein